MLSQPKRQPKVLSQPRPVGAAFQLVSTRPAPESYKLERRATPRRPASGRVTAVCTHGEDGSLERFRRITSLELCDSSEGGLGVTCEHALPIGCRVALLLPPHGPEQGFDLFGQVVRCDQAGGRYRIGIALDLPMTACA